GGGNRVPQSKAPLFVCPRPKRHVGSMRDHVQNKVAEHADGQDRSFSPTSTEDKRKREQSRPEQGKDEAVGPRNVIQNHVRSRHESRDDACVLNANQNEDWKKNV